MSPKPWFVVITGASSGFGRAMARGLLTRAGLAPAGSTFLLVARSTEQLAQTKTLMEESGIEANVSLLSADLSDLGAISQKVVPRMAEMLAAAGDVFGRVMLVNNAGSLGNISDRIDKAGACPDTLQSYFNLNLTGVITLTAAFVKDVKQSCPGAQVDIVNISSLMAVQPAGYWTLYCTGKAARNMLHACIAQEFASDAVRTLNYAPGPLDTPMQATVRTELGAEEMRQTFDNYHKTGALLSAEASADKLLVLLRDSKFESGSHHDYYDLPEPTF